MEQGAIEILKKHGCLYMKDDYKALFEELEAYYKPTEAVKNNAVLSHVVGRSEQLPCAYCEEAKPLKYCQECWDKLEQFKQCY